MHTISEVKYMANSGKLHMFPAPMVSWMYTQTTVTGSERRSGEWKVEEEWQQKHRSFCQHGVREERQQLHLSFCWDRGWNKKERKLWQTTAQSVCVCVEQRESGEQNYYHLPLPGLMGGGREGGGDATHSLPIPSPKAAMPLLTLLLG